MRCRACSFSVGIGKNELFDWGITLQLPSRISSFSTAKIGPPAVGGELLEWGCGGGRICAARYAILSAYKAHEY